MLLPLLVGMPVILCNMLLQSLVAVCCIRFYIRRFRHKEGFVAGTFALFGTITIVLLGNLLQILLWGMLFLWLGSFRRSTPRCTTPALTLPPSATAMS